MIEQLLHPNRHQVHTMSTIHRLLVRVSVGCGAALLSACAARHAPNATLLWSEARQCPRRPTVEADSVAVAAKCAEEFVARNGYTLTPPAVGNAQLAEESFETGEPWSRVLARRRGTLVPKAVQVCLTASDRADMAYTVVFRYSDTRVTSVARVVTMDRNFGQMRMQQADVRVSALANPDMGCVWGATAPATPSSTATP